MSFRPGFSMAAPTAFGYQSQPIFFNPLVARPFSGAATTQAAATPPTRGPTTTVFIGNISDKCSNEFMQQMLQECGGVTSWKRMQGSNGKFQAFGFCDYDAPEGTLRALRVLNDFQIGEKKLIVKAEDKVRDDLRRWAIDQRKAQGKPELRLQDNELPADEDDMKKDEEVRLKILNWIETDHPQLLLVEDTDASPKNGRKKETVANKKDGKRRRSVSRSQSRSRSRSRGRKRSRSRSAKRRHRRRHSSSSSYSSSGSSSGSSSSRSRTRSPKRKRDNRRNSTESDDEERKELKRKLKEKEQLYDNRLKKWEKREREQARRYQKEEKQKRDRARFIQKEAKKLRSFLEDYDDEKDDPKYYTSSSLFNRKRDYEREREADQKDRLREQAEIEEIMQQLIQENMDADQANKVARKKHQEQEDAVLRRIRADSGSPNPHQLLGQQEAAGGGSSSGSSVSNDSDVEPAEPSAPPTVANEAPKGPQTPTSAPPPNDRWCNVEPAAQVANASPAVAEAKTISFQSDPHQRSLTQRIQGVFGFDDEEVQSNAKRQKFEVTQEERLASLTEEEKKKMIKDLIGSIPTSKEDIFGFNIQWEFLTKPVIEQRVKPWIDRKIKEFIGDDDNALSDFICESIEKKTEPKKILDDVAMIFDDDAEQFVIKMWRLIIYESEAKKLGISRVK